MKKYFIFFIVMAINYQVSGQDLSNLIYDANGNRISKQIKGSSPIPELSGFPENVNPGQPVSLQASGCDNGIIKWSTGQQGTSITVTPNSTTIYTAECEVSVCPTNGFERITVNVVECLTYAISAGTSSNTVKLGQPVSLTAFGCVGGTIKWNTGQTGDYINTTVYLPSNIYKATCTTAFCDDQGVGYVIVGGTTGCLPGDVLITKQNGSWSDPNTWACNKVPTLQDEVLLNHEVSLYGVNGYAKSVILNNGYIVYSDTGQLYMPTNN